MNSKLLFALSIAAIAAAPALAGAQAEARTYRIEPGRAFGFSMTDGDETRAVIGVTTSTGSARDTLGLLVSSVTAGGPAEKAGIEEGNRIASINGINLKLAPADVGDWDMASIMSRRLTRELGKVKAGSDVELRVYGGGQNRTVRLKTVAYDSLYHAVTRWRVDADNRAALGVGLGSSGSRRDTLGVLVTWVNDSGPAAKAGIEEGNRIAAINNVDVRVSRDDAGDEMISSVKAQRVQRELEKLKPGDDVELRLYADGKSRTVKVKTVALSKLSGSRSMFFGNEGAMTLPRMMPMPPMPPMPSMAPHAHITRISM